MVLVADNRDNGKDRGATRFSGNTVMHDGRTLDDHISEIGVRLLSGGEIPELRDTIQIGHYSTFPSPPKTPQIGHGGTSMPQQIGHSGTPVNPSKGYSR